MLQSSYACPSKSAIFTESVNVSDTRVFGVWSFLILLLTLIFALFVDGLYASTTNSDSRASEIFLQRSGESFFIPGVSSTLLADEWDDLNGGVSGDNAVVTTMAVLGNYLYAGGEFDQAGASATSNIARYNLVTSVWEAIPLGPNNVVKAIDVHDGKLFVGGFFTEAGGQPYSRLAIYNPASGWSAPTHRPDGDVYTIRVVGDDVYVGGDFSQVGALSVQGAARYHVPTDTWHRIGNASADFFAGTGIVMKILWDGDHLFISGAFEVEINSVTTSGIVQYTPDSDTWQALGIGISEFTAPTTLAVHDGKIYAGGGNMISGDLAGDPDEWIMLSNIGVFDYGDPDRASQVWSSFGNVLNNMVTNLLIKDEYMFVTGLFSMVDGNAERGVAVYNLDLGTWSGLGGGVSMFGFGGGESLSIAGGKVIVGGGFDDAGGTSVSNIARWSGDFGFDDDTDPIDPGGPGAPLAFDLLTPDDEESGVLLDPFFSWEPSDGAESYTLLIGFTPDLQPFPLMEIPDISTTEYTYGFDPFFELPLFPNTTYYWQVIAVNDDGQTPSDIWSFTTAGPPVAFTLLSPDDQAEELDIFGLTFTWQESSNADEYELILASDAGFDEVVLRKTGLIQSGSPGDDISYTMTLSDGSLDAGATYYWMVIASNEDGETPSTDEFQFTTIDRPGDFLLSLPAIDALDVELAPEFSWVASNLATEYILQISTVSDFTSILHHFPNIVGTTFTPDPPFELGLLSQYYWRVRAVNGGGMTDSEIRSFTTRSNSPGPVVLVSPGIDETGVSFDPSPIFEWEPSARATRYELTVEFILPFFTNTVQVNASDIDKINDDGNYFYQWNFPFYHGFDYTWRVKAINENDNNSESISEDRVFWSDSIILALAGPDDEADEVNSETAFRWEDDTFGRYQIQFLFANDEDADPLGDPDSGIQIDIVLNELQDEQVVLTLAEIFEFAAELDESVITSLWDQTMYWRVRPNPVVDYLDNKNRMVNWSEIREFTLQTPVVLLDLPDEDATNVPIDHPLTWTQFEYASANQPPAYAVQLITLTDIQAMDNSLDLVGLFDPALPGDFLPGDTSPYSRSVDFEYETSYAWRVAATSNGLVSYSIPRKFTTIPEPPGPFSLLSPGIEDDETSGISVQPVFSWSPSALADEYRFTVRYDLQQSDPVDGSITVLEILLDANDPELLDLQGNISYSPVDQLHIATEYYWFVEAINRGGELGTSPAQFSTVPYILSLVAPEPGEDDAPASVGEDTEFRWSIAERDDYDANTSQWNLQILFENEPDVDLTSNPLAGRELLVPFDNDNIAGEGTNDGSIGMIPFTHDTMRELVSRWGDTMYWRVVPESPLRPVSDDDTGVSGEVRFVMAPSDLWPIRIEVPTIALEAPIDLATGLPLNTTLTWPGFNYPTGSAQPVYRVQLLELTAEQAADEELDLADLFGALPSVSDFSDFHTSPFTPDEPDLEFDKTYAWRVIAFSNGQTATSEIRTFGTVKDVPGPVTITSPVNGAIEVPISGATLHWTPGQYAESYEAQIKIPIFSPEWLSTFTASDNSLDISASLPNITAYYRVRSVNSIGTSDWSDPVSFTYELSDFAFDDHRYFNIGRGVTSGNSSILDMARHENHIYTGGFFTSMGGYGTNNIARYSIASGVWEPLGSGLNGGVRALLVHDGYVYVGGDFSHAGGQNARGIARYEIETGMWRSLPGNGVTGAVISMVLIDGKIAVGGQFSAAGGQPTSNLAFYDPTSNSWQIPAHQPNNMVLSLAAHGNELFMGGYFDAVGGVSVGGFAAYDLDSDVVTSIGNPTFPSSGLFNFRWLKLKEHLGQIIFAGNFTSVNGDDHRGIALFNIEDRTWEGAGLNGVAEVYGIGVAGPYRFIGYAKTTQLGQSVSHGVAVLNTRVNQGEEGYAHYVDGSFDGLVWALQPILKAGIGMTPTLDVLIGGFFQQLTVGNTSKAVSPSMELDDAGETMAAGTTRHSRVVMLSVQRPPLPVEPTPVITMVYPTSGDSPVGVRPEFSWEPDPAASSYRLVVSKNADLSDPVFVSTPNIPRGQSTYTHSQPLDFDTRYYWLVIGLNSAGDGNPNDTQTFRTRPKIIAGVPQLVSPIGGATNVSVTPELRWKSVPNVSKYHLELLELVVDENGNEFLGVIYQNLDITHDTQADEQKITIEEDVALIGFRQYYWRLRSVSIDEEGEWSVPEIFTTIFDEFNVIADPTVGDRINLLRTPRIYGEVFAMESYGDKILIGGNFNGGENVPDGSSLLLFDPQSPPESSLSFISQGQNHHYAITGSIYSILVDGDDIYVGGSFNRVHSVNTFFSMNVNNVVRFTLQNGQLTPVALGSGVNGEVRTMVKLGNRVVIGGLFTIADGRSSIGIASYTPSGNTGTMQAHGTLLGESGTASGVYSMLLRNGHLYVGYGFEGGSESLDFLGTYSPTFSKFKVIRFNSSLQQTNVLMERVYNFRSNSIFGSLPNTELNRKAWRMPSFLITDDHIYLIEDGSVVSYDRHSGNTSEMISGPITLVKYEKRTFRYESSFTTRRDYYTNVRPNLTALKIVGDQLFISGDFHGFTRGEPQIMVRESGYSNIWNSTIARFNIPNHEMIKIDFNSTSNSNPSGFSFQPSYPGHHSNVMHLHGKHMYLAKTDLWYFHLRSQDLIPVTQLMSLDLHIIPIRPSAPRPVTRSTVTTLNRDQACAILALLGNNTCTLSKEIPASDLASAEVSGTIGYKTDEHQPDSANPGEVTATENDDHVNITSGEAIIPLVWEPSVADEEEDLPTTHYVVHYREIGMEEWMSLDRPESLDTIAVITGLKSNTTYQIRIAAANINGPGTFTDPFEVESFELDEIIEILTDFVETQPVSIDSGDGLPTEFALMQNYPNPFNPVTTIRFALPQASPVRLEVYNVLGQRVAVLVDGFMGAGWHSMQLDASRWASGTYIYRIQAGDFQMTRKLMLIK